MQRLLKGKDEKLMKGTWSNLTMYVDVLMDISFIGERFQMLH